MKRLKKLTVFFLIIFTIFNTTSFALTNEQQLDNSTNTSEENSDELSFYSESCILVECSKNKIAYEKDSDKKMYPASTTKVLTAIITMQKCKLDDVVTITPPMINQIPSGYKIAYLQVGKKYTVEQLLNLLLVPSANDAGYALAIHISGSIEDFSKLMNDTAKSIGCTNSNFTNPCGIHNENHYTTAKDLSKIAMKVLDYPELVEICKKDNYVFNGQNFNTTNTLIDKNTPNYFEFATGLKTGFTDEAGYCLIATAEKNNMKFLAVVLNSPKSTNQINYRDCDCALLFNYGFEHFNEITFEPEEYKDILNRPIFKNDTLGNIFRILLILLILFIIFSLMKKKKKKKINRRKKRR